MRNIPSRASKNSKYGIKLFPRHSRFGFTLIELMIVMVIVAIGVALAVPTFKTITEKRQLTRAAEEIVNFVSLAQAEAIKRNDEVTVAWWKSGTANSHSTDFCMGISAPPKATPCNCRVTLETAANYCAVGSSADDAADGIAYRLVKEDFVDLSSEFLHMNPPVGNLGFDPIRGTVVNPSSTTVYNTDFFIKVHSSDSTEIGNKRLYALRIRLNPTGRLTICSESDRQMRVGAYDPCS